jgi:TPP-dependent pyruvate/acetoin dehydrogenase alpha subunit
MPTLAVDGNDVLAVHAAADEAVRRARSGDGPSLLACTTYRTRPHSEGMRDGGYRSREEVEEWRARDPIKRLREHLVSSAASVESTLDAIDREIDQMARDALEWAKASPYPDPATVLDHVYA